MRNLISIIALVIITVFSANTTFANNAADSTIMFTASRTAMTATGAFGEVVGNERGSRVEVSYNSPEYVRRAKELSKDFTGYKIELVTVYNAPLALNDKMFQTFGGITFEKRSDNSYTYLLGGNFDDKKAVEAFLNDIVKAKYPNAKGVKYNKGNQVKFK